MNPSCGKASFGSAQTRPGTPIASTLTESRAHGEHTSHSIGAVGSRPKREISEFTVSSATRREALAGNLRSTVAAAVAGPLGRLSREPAI